MMKNKFQIIFSFVAFLFVVLFGSCDRDVNDWAVEDVPSRLFRPLMLEASLLKPTEVELKYSSTMDVAQYVFEFSKDDFASIVKQVVILADTVTPYATSENPMRIEYRTMFTGLDGTTDYFVRLYAVNADLSLNSEYVSYKFTTPAEMLFNKIVMSIDRMWFYWNSEAAVTNIVFQQGETTIEDRVLSESEKAAGMAVFTGLTSGTVYTASIYNGDVLRGSWTGRTTGIAGGNVLEVRDGDNAETVYQGLTELALRGEKNITVSFTPGKTYEMGGAINIPDGVENIDFVGAEDESGVFSTLENVRVRILGTTINNITFQGLKMTGGGDFFFQADAGKTFHKVLFENCYVSNVNSAVRLAGNAATPTVGDSIVLNNCWMSQTGGWSLLNVGSGNLLGTIIVSNTTLTEMDTRFADIRSKTEILFKNVTACNIAKGMGHLWLFDNNALATVTLENCIISGPNGGVKLNSTSGNYTVMPIYDNNYKTNDLVEDVRLLTGITTVQLDIYQLFVDPANGDFHIRKGTGFAGTGVAGDPRWFDQ